DSNSCKVVEELNMEIGTRAKRERKTCCARKEGEGGWFVVQRHKAVVSQLRRVVAVVAVA
ncbi:hypothetical protein A2U01_0080244, partial [Trifolium medium]|nr:hypothetical protein [Trifolium medium]